MSSIFTVSSDELVYLNFMENYIYSVNFVSIIVRYSDIN